MVDGVPTTGLFASDFTLAEIKTLRAVQAFPERRSTSTAASRSDARRRSSTLVKRESRKRDRRIGIYPETKHPTYHKELGLPLEPRLVQDPEAGGLGQPQRPGLHPVLRAVEPQGAQPLTPSGWSSWSTRTTSSRDGTLDTWRRSTGPTTGPSPATRARGAYVRLLRDRRGPREISTYADGIGPWKRYIVSTLRHRAGGDTHARRRPRDLIERAHDARPADPHLDVPQRAEPARERLRGQPDQRVPAVLRARIDGVFSDFPDTAFTARELLRVE